MLIQVFLFPADSATPQLAKVPLRKSSTLDCQDFIPGETESIRSDFFTNEDIRSLPKAYHILHKSDFLIDGSDKNQCVWNLFNKYEQRVSRSNILSSEIRDPFWRNNILVAKAKPGGASFSGTVDETSLEDMLQGFDNPNRIGSSAVSIAIGTDHQGYFVIGG